MSIVYGAVIPHSPLLLSAIAKDHWRSFEPTAKKIALAGQELYARQPDLIVVFTPHGPEINGSLVVQVADRYRADLSQFGHLSLDKSWPCPAGIIHQLKEFLESRDVNIKLQTAPALDYGTAVSLIVAALPSDLPIIPITIAHYDAASLINYGSLIAEYFKTTKQRVALIASADLCRTADRTTHDRAPETMEKKISQAITALDIGAFPKLNEPADCCGARPILSWLAACSGLNARPVILDFSAPMNVGLLTASAVIGT